MLSAVTPPEDAFKLEGITIKGRWNTREYIQKGAFGRVHVATNIQTNANVAIKFEMPNAKKQMLKVEIAYLRKIDSPYICKFIAGGRFATRDQPESVYSYMVMQLLGERCLHNNDSLSSLRKKAGGSFKIGTSALCAIDALYAIQSIHAAGILHRDIKPGNMCINLENNRVVLVDFGLARRFVDENGKCREARQNVGFRGTARYASVNAHSGVESSRADDLFSLLYVIIEFITGKLPWKGKEKASIKESKEKLADNWLESLPVPLSDFFLHIKNLSYESEPNYNYLIGTMKNLHFLSGEPITFDWRNEVEAGNSINDSASKNEALIWPPKPPPSGVVNIGSKFRRVLRIST